MGRKQGRTNNPLLLVRADVDRYRDEARYAVLDAIARITPKVFADLLKSYQADPSMFVVAKWATRYQLDRPWVIHWARSAVKTWGNDGRFAFRKSYPGKWDHPGLCGVIENWNPPNPDDPDDILNPLLAAPHLTDRATFLARAAQHYDAWSQFLESKGYYKPTWHRQTIEHAEWFVRYKFLGNSSEDIAAAIDGRQEQRGRRDKSDGQRRADARTVRAALTQLANRIDLDYNRPNRKVSDTHRLT
jgi:hypothetical protein